jgi:hypothetical protein
MKKYLLILILIMAAMANAQVDVDWPPCPDSLKIIDAVGNLLGYSWPPILQAGTQVTITLVPPDTVRISATGGGTASVDTFWVHNDADTDSLSNVGHAIHELFGTGLDVTFSGQRATISVDKSELSLSFSDISGTIDSTKIVNVGISLPKIASGSASPGQTIKWNGSAWAPADDQVGAAGSGTSDTLIVNASGVEYTIVSNRIKLKAGSGIVMVRNDSTTYDAIFIRYDTTANMATGNLYHITSAVAESLFASLRAVRTIVHDSLANYVLTTALDKITDDTTNFKTAYGWGNHAGLYVVVADFAKITDDTTNFKVAYDSVSAWDNRGYPDATVSLKGIASFATANFSVTSGAVSIKSGGVGWTELTQAGKDSIQVRQNAAQVRGIAGDSVGAHFVKIDTNGVTAGNIVTVPKPIYQAGFLIKISTPNGDTVVIEVDSTRILSMANLMDSVNAKLGGTSTRADNYVLKIDTTPDPDTFYWAADNAGAGATGSADSLYINDGSAEYGLLNNKLKIKEGAGINIIRDDSTSYDVFRFTVATDGVNDLMIDFGAGTNQVNTADIVDPTMTSSNGKYNRTHVGEVTGESTLVIASNIIDSTNILTGAIDSAEVKVGAITKPKLAANSVSTYAIYPDSVNDTDIDWGTGANQVSTDDVPQGSTNTYNPFGADVGWAELATANQDTIKARQTAAQVRAILPDSLNKLVFSHIGTDSIATSKIAWDYEYILLQVVHGRDRANEDSIYLRFPVHNSISSWLAQDSSGNITAGDLDTFMVSGYVPFACIIDSISVMYRTRNAADYITSVDLYGPDISTFTNLTDSLYYTSATDLTGTSWTIAQYLLTNAITAAAGYRYAFRFITYWGADNRAIDIGWVRLRVRR